MSMTDSVEKVRRLLVVVLCLTAFLSNAVSTYEISLVPDAAKRRAIVIQKGQGPATASLLLRTSHPWLIDSSRIATSDDCLWYAANTPARNSTHVYRLVNADSSEQYVRIAGSLTRSGSESGRKPVFRATVPAVDVDWQGREDGWDENDEDTWARLCSMTAGQDERARLVVRRPQDDLSLVSGRMTIECRPADVARLLKTDGTPWGGTAIAVSATPLTLLVDPLRPGTFTVTLRGTSDGQGGQPTDYLVGRVVRVDLDVDTNGDGMISDADDAREETPGCFFGVSTNALVPIALTMEPADRPGRLTLSASYGGERIRVWKTRARTGEIRLPKTWNAGDTVPNMLYVEGVSPSELVRDVELCLAYDDDPDGRGDEERTCEDKIHLTVVEMELITPAGDPVNAPVLSGEGQNEFTYSTDNPGVLTMNLRARVTPWAAAGQVRNRCRFEVGAVDGSVMAWAAANPGGRPTAYNGVLRATATFTGLPASNAAFGAKKARFFFDDTQRDESDYEVFFPRDAANNVDGVPNWFFYWRSLISVDNVVYAGNSGGDMMAEVRGMTLWSYSDIPDKCSIFIYDETVTKTRPYGVGKEMSGIDMFVGTVLHERQHLIQIAAADALLPTSGNDSFRYGWSWNQAVHNHWRKGADGEWGVAAIDDDGNGFIDDAKPLPPFEPGHDDDVSLDHVSYIWWPSAWPLPIPNNTDHPIESEAVNATDNAMNEHDYAPYDWGAPGKNHKTVRKWDD